MCVCVCVCACPYSTDIKINKITFSHDFLET